VEQVRALLALMVAMLPPQEVVEVELATVTVATARQASSSFAI
jgi:hypothetical protein